MKFTKAISSLLFCLIFIAMLVSLTYVLRVDSDVKTRLAGFYAEEEDTIDVLVMGSSAIGPYYAAPLVWEEYGYTSYPVSTNIQQPKAIIHLLKEALKYQHPKVVVIELRMFCIEQSTFDTSSSVELGIRGVTDSMKYSINRINTINAFVDDKEQRFSYYFDIAKYHSNWKSNLRGSNILAYWNFENKDQLKGQLIVPMLEQFEQQANVNIEGFMEFPQEQHLRELLEFGKQNDLELLFVVSPRVSVGEEEGKMYNSMEAITSEYNYNFINYNEKYDELGVDFLMDFYNESHMNINGAEKYTRHLGAYMKETYNLESKKEDSSYAEWDSSYEKWRTRADKAKNAIAELEKELE